MESNSVKLATRKDLFRIVSFLDDKLPLLCEVHQFVQAALLTASPVYTVYYSSNKNDDIISAILGVEAAHTMDVSTQKLKNIWLLTAWTDDGMDGGECPTLQHMFESLTEIDWKKDSVFAITRNRETNKTVMDFLDVQSGAADIHIIPGDRYFITKEEALNLKIEIPSDVYLSSLERRHAQLIFDNWSHNISSSVEEVENEIEKMPSVGLFLKSNDQLVCWMVSNPPFGMGLLFTLEGHRRRGYAKLVTHSMSKRMAQSGFVPFVTIVQGNSSSFAFFQSLGFRPLICSIYGLLRSP